MSALEGIVTSPKVNRYLPWVAGLVLLAGVISFVVVQYSNTVPANPNEKLSSKPATQETSLGKAIALPKSARSVAARFIDAGVRGHDPQLAYRLSGPEIRDGYTSLKQWMHDWKTVGVPFTFDNVCPSVGWRKFKVGPLSSMAMTTWADPERPSSVTAAVIV